MNRRSFAYLETERLNRNLFLFHDDNAVIEMNAAHVQRIVIWRQCSARVEGVQLIDKPFGKFNEGIGFV